MSTDVMRARTKDARTGSTGGRGKGGRAGMALGRADAAVPGPIRDHGGTGTTSAGSGAFVDGEAAPPRTTAGPRGLLNSRRIRTHLGTVAGVVILGVLLWRLGTGVFLDGLRRINGTTLLAALGLGLLTTVLSAWRWCLVARGLRIRLPLGPAVADYYRAL
ncbi:UPF0104 family protein, partial [Streptomyces sp. NPDC058272]